MENDKNIPVVILCGGMETRLAEYTGVRPKPLVEVGGRPIIWHIMKHYSRYGFNEFILALDYKGEQIKRYFLDLHTLNQREKNRWDTLSCPFLLLFEAIYAEFTH